MSPSQIPFPVSNNTIQSQIAHNLHSRLAILHQEERRWKKFYVDKKKEIKKRKEGRGRNQ